MPHTQRTQGIKGNSRNFQVEENCRETQGDSKNFDLFFKLSETQGSFDFFHKIQKVLIFENSQENFLLGIDCDLINLVQYFVEQN